MGLLTSLTSVLAIARSTEVEVELDLDEVYRAHAGAVATWAARLAGPGHDIEDLVHEVFLVVDRQLSGFRGDAKLTTWLYRITANVVAKERRRRKVRRWLSLDSVPEPLDEAEGPTEDLLRQERRRVVYVALDELKEIDRQALVLSALEGMSGAEIAELLGISTSAVWVRIHRAKKRFAKALEGKL